MFKSNRKLKHLRRSQYLFIQEKSAVGLNNLLPLYGEAPPLSSLEKFSQMLGTQPHDYTGRPSASLLMRILTHGILGWRASHLGSTWIFHWQGSPQLPSQAQNVPCFPVHLNYCCTRAYLPFLLKSIFTFDSTKCLLSLSLPIKKKSLHYILHKLYILCEAFLETLCSDLKPFLFSVQTAEEPLTW